MKQIIPFNKEITFKTMISKITSISLEHTLDLLEEDTIGGDFIVSGSYKMTEASQIDEEFSYKIPIEITIDSKYDTSNISLDIDDFVYEVIDEEKLLLKIDLCIDNLELIEEYKEDLIEDAIVSDSLEEQMEERCIDENEVEDLFLDTSTEEDLQIPINNNDTNSEIDFDNDDSNMPKTLPLNPGEKLVMPTPTITTKNTSSDSSNNVASIFSAFKDTDETFSTYCIYIMREGDTLDTVLNKYNTTRDILSEYNDLSDIRIGSKIIIPSTNE